MTVIDELLLLLPSYCCCCHSLLFLLPFVIAIAKPQQLETIMTDNRSGVTGGTSFGGTMMTTRLIIRDFGGRNRLDSLNNTWLVAAKCQVDVNDSNMDQARIRCNKI